MNGRIRKFGLVGVVVGGALLFGVGFAGAQSSSGDAPSKPDSGGAPSFAGTSGDGQGCDHGASAEVSSIDL